MGRLLVLEPLFRRSSTPGGGGLIAFKNLGSLIRNLYNQFQRRSVNMSSIYRPVHVAPPEPKGKASVEKPQKKKKGDEDLSKSLKLLVDNGLIRPSSCSGAYNLLPIGLKAMEKLIGLVDSHMMNLDNCQKIQMPVLTLASLWKITDRLDACKTELMRVQDRHSKEFLLSPTHEEAICDLIRTSAPMSYRQLPQRLYQITEKFRDELRPRFGLMRGRQFLMKDLYTFDTDLEQAKATYEQVNQVYRKLLDSLDLTWTMAQGSTGSIGGVMSHEFHILSEIGEDSILLCDSCKHSFNVEFLEQQHEEEEEGEVVLAANSGGTGSTQTTKVIPKCINCKESSSLSSSTSIEVGHSFLLSTKYTKPMGVTYNTEGGGKVLMEMGCYGLGVSRLLAASVEVKSTNEELRWPLRIAPYVASILPPKQGSKEETKGAPLASKMYESLQKILPRDILFDDRTNYTIGKRLQDHKRLGIPYVVVCGKSVTEPSQSGSLLELHDVNNGTVTLDRIDNIARFLYDVKSKIKMIEM